MAQAVNVNFRLDENVKKSMEAACDELGLSMSAAFTIFAKKVAREKRIPFEVSVANGSTYDDTDITETEYIDAEIQKAEQEYAGNGQLLDARETLDALWGKHFG